MVYKLLITSKNINEIQSVVQKIAGNNVEHTLTQTERHSSSPTIADLIPQTVDVPMSSAPVVGIPIVVQPAPAAVPTGVAVDVTGVPWNPNLHSSSKKMNADGSWKKKKNFGGGDTTEAAAPQALYKDPTAIVHQATTPLVAPPAPTVQVAVPQFNQQAAQPVVPQTVVASPNQTATTYQNIPTVIQTTERPALDYQSFKNDLPMTMTRLISSGQVKQEYVNQLNQYFGIDQIFKVLGDERKCMELFNVLSQQGFITKVDNYPPNVAHASTGQQVMNGVQ